MRKILIDLLNGKITPIAQEISKAKQELVQIELDHDKATDHDSIIIELTAEIESVLESIASTERKIAEITPPVDSASTPKKASPSSKSQKFEELQRLHSLLKFDLEIKEKRLDHHKTQLSFPVRIEELEASIIQNNEVLDQNVEELKQLILNGENLSVFRWTRKLDLFAHTNGFGLMHYLAHNDILHYVLPVMLENSQDIIKRELGNNLSKAQSQQQILERLSELDKSGLPPIQRALINGSMESFEYMLQLPNCKKGIFEVGNDRSNIFHQAILKGVFQQLIPFIEEGLPQLIEDEKFIPDTGDAKDHINLMLTSKNSRGFSPAKLAAYVASAPYFRYICDTGVLKLNSGQVERQLETYTSSGRTISKVASDRVSKRTTSLDEVDLSNAASSADAGESSDTIHHRIIETPLTKEDLLLDYLFSGARHLEPFIINLVDNGCVEIFDAILERQRTTQDFGLAKYIIQITRHVRNIKSLEADHPKFKEIISIYRKIFKEYWPEITINDNNLKAHDQLKALAQQMDSLGGKVLGIPSDKLREALSISESELSEYGGDIFAAAQSKLFDQLAHSYESDVTAKAAATGNPLLATPSPVKINVRNVVSSTVKKEVLQRDCPEVLDQIAKTVEEVEAVVAPTDRQKLDEVTGLNNSLRELDSPCRNTVRDLVKIEISDHIDLIFKSIVALKDLPDNEDIKNLYDQANPEAESPDDADVIGTILLLATGMRVAPGLFLNFVNDATYDVNGEEVTNESFMKEFIGHIGIERLAQHGCINFEGKIAAVIIEALHEAGKLTCGHLEYALEVDNQDAIDIAMSTGNIKWEDALFLAFQVDNLGFLDRYIEMSTFTSAKVAEISRNLFPSLLKSLIDESLKIYEDIEDETIAHGSLNEKVAFVATFLNSDKTSSDQGISIGTEQLKRFITVFDSFEDPGRTLDYSAIKQNLVFIAESLKPILKESETVNDLTFFLQNDFAAQLTAAEKGSRLLEDVAPQLEGAGALSSSEHAVLSGDTEETVDGI